MQPGISKWPYRTPSSRLAAFLRLPPTSIKPEQVHQRVWAKADAHTQAFEQACAWGQAQAQAKKQAHAEVTAQAKAESEAKRQEKRKVRREELLQAMVRHREEREKAHAEARAQAKAESEAKKQAHAEAKAQTARAPIVAPDHCSHEAMLGAIKGRGDKAGVLLQYADLQEEGRLTPEEIACDGIAAENLLSLLGSVQGWTERLDRTIRHFGYVACQFVKNDLQPQEFFVTLARNVPYDPNLRDAVRGAKLQVHSPILACLDEQVLLVVIVVVLVVLAFLLVVLVFLLLHVLIL